MRGFLISIIDFYQKIPFQSHRLCRFQPTCSQYAKEAILEYGTLKGCFLTMIRILKCNPWGPYGYDPVPKKENSYEKS